MLTEHRKERFTSVIGHRSQDVVVLENIHDPHNAAAAIRNCDAFGIQTAHFVFELEKVFNPQALGRLTSASANKWIDTVCWDKTKDCFDDLHAKGFHIIATIIDPRAKPLTEVNLADRKVAIVFGNEGGGISAVAKELADELVYIPMSGFIDSINISVSVGVMLWELARQRQAGHGFPLDEKEKANLLRKWTDAEIKQKLRI